MHNNKKKSLMFLLVGESEQNAKIKNFFTTVYPKRFRKISVTKGPKNLLKIPANPPWIY